MVLETSPSSRKPISARLSWKFPRELWAQASLCSGQLMRDRSSPNSCRIWDPSAAPAMETGEFQQLRFSQVGASSWQYQGRNWLCCPWAPIEKRIKLHKNLSKIDKWHLKCPKNLIVSISMFCLLQTEFIFLHSAMGFGLGWGFFYYIFSKGRSKLCEIGFNLLGNDINSGLN